MSWLTLAVLIYALIMFGGGVGGYAVAHSLPSLITGIVAGVLLVIAAVLARTNSKVGYGLAAVVALALGIVFIRRYFETGKPMPSLGLLGLSVLMLVVLAAGHFMLKNPS